MSTRSTVEVTAPDGTRWQVRRRWLPRLGHETLWARFRRRTTRARRRGVDLLEHADPGCAEVLGEGILAGIALIVALVVLVLVVIPLALAAVDVAILVLLALVGVAARILFRRPWVVEAVHVPVDPARGSLRWRVVGWRASADRCREVAQTLKIGVTPPGAETYGVPFPPDVASPPSPAP